MWRDRGQLRKPGRIPMQVQYNTRGTGWRLRVAGAEVFRAATYTEVRNWWSNKDKWPLPVPKEAR